MARYLVRHAAWAAGFLAVIAAVALASGAGRTGVAESWPHWVANAAVAAAYPAALRASHGRTRSAIAGALVAAGAVLVLLGWGAPIRPSPAGSGIPLHRLPAATSAAAAAGDWLRANRLAFRLLGDLSLAALVPVFAGIGALVGRRTAALRLRELAAVQEWAIAFLLVAGTYLVSENAYEKLVLRVAGEAYYAGLLALVAPVLILAVLAWTDWVDRT